jgi:pimeloyl-ACP methyl ester carboxylesterase
MRAAIRLLLALAALAMPAADAGAALRFEPCKSWECSTLRVPLDHSGGRPGSIDLHVERIGEGDGANGALIALSGGPGQSAAGLTEDFNRSLPGLGRRDLIVYDQRGTGQSGALRCPEIQNTDMTDAGDEAASCARRLGPRRAFYTTRDTVADIEALRRELGIERISLYGVSYGTKVALAYAATHPERVERLILDSVVGWPDGPDAFNRPTTTAMPRVLRALCRGRCGAITSDPAEDLARVVDRIADGGLAGTAFDGRGRPRRIPIRRGDLFSMLLFGDLFGAIRGDLPAAYASAVRGDRALLARFGYRPKGIADVPGQPATEYSQALYATTTCEESELPWDRTAPFEERRAQARERAALLPGDAFEPFDRESALDSDVIRMCERWPTGADAPTTPSGPLPDVPVLIMNGENDLRTPLEDARALAELFPRATLVTDAVGHSVLFASRCAQAAVRAFFRDREQGPCRRAHRVPVRELPPLSARELRPLGATGRRGRTLRALESTLRDLKPRLGTELFWFDGEPVRAGGLRGGYVTSARRIRLFRYAYVPGVRVSGTLRVERNGRGPLGGELTLSGPAAAAGRVELRAGRLKGMLARRAVRARIVVRR